MSEHFSMTHALRPPRPAPGAVVLGAAAIGIGAARRAGSAASARLERRRPVRVQRQLEHQHRQRLLRRAAVQPVDLGGLRRGAATPPAPTSRRAAQQIAVAERVLAGQGVGAWPTCGRCLTGGSTPAVAAGRTAPCAAPAATASARRRRTGRAARRHATRSSPATRWQDRRRARRGRRLAGRCGRGTRARSAIPNLIFVGQTLQALSREHGWTAGVDARRHPAGHWTHAPPDRGLTEAPAGMIDAVPVPLSLEAPACPLPPSSPSGRPCPSGCGSRSTAPSTT